MTREQLTFGQRCERFSAAATKWTGSTAAQMAAVATVVVWLFIGPIFGMEETWHLVFEPITAIVPFLMVFLIQRSQNKDSLAVQLKLNELVAAVGGASNRLVDVEDLSEDELRVLRKHYQQLAEMAKSEMEIGKSHSVEEAHERHTFKQKGRSPQDPQDRR